MKMTLKAQSCRNCGFFGLNISILDSFLLHFLSGRLWNFSPYFSLTSWAVQLHPLTLTLVSLLLWGNAHFLLTLAALFLLSTRFLFSVLSFDRFRSNILACSKSEGYSVTGSAQMSVNSLCATKALLEMLRIIPPSSVLFCTLIKVIFKALLTW